MKEIEEQIEIQVEKGVRGNPKNFEKKYSTSCFSNHTFFLCGNLNIQKII